MRMNNVYKNKIIIINSEMAPQCLCFWSRNGIKSFWLPVSQCNRYALHKFLEVTPKNPECFSFPSFGLNVLFTPWNNFLALTGAFLMQPGFRNRSIHGYVNILTWQQGFQDKCIFGVVFFVSKSPLENVPKETLENRNFDPKSSDRC